MGKRSREKRERREKGEIKSHPERESLLSSICLKIIRLGTYLVLFAPLIISGRYFFPFVGPKSIYFFALVEIIFVAYLLLILLKPKYRPRFNILLIAIILFVAVLILSSFLGEDFSRSFWSKYERMTGLLMWFHLLAFFVVLSSVFKKREDWFKIFGVSVFAAILMGIISLLAKIDINLLGGMGISTRGGATIGNSSFLGTYLLFNIFLALYLLLKSRGGLRIYSGISLAIISLALFLSDARAAIFSVLGGVVLLFFLWLIFSKKGILKLAGVSLLIIFAIGVLGLIYLSSQPDSFVYQKLVQMASKSRIVVWEMAWKGWLERPWLGWGPENFELVFTKYYDPRLFLSEYGGEVWFDRVHNIVFDTLIASGIIGFLSYLGIFISAFYVLWRKYFREKLDFWIAGIFSVILISYFVQNLTVFDMVNSYMMFFLVLGFIGSIALTKEVSNQSAAPPLKRIPGSLNPWIAIVILILFGFCFLNCVIQPLKTDAHVIKAIRSPDSNQRLNFYEKTLTTSPVGKYQIRETLADSLITLSQKEEAKKIPKENLIKEFEFLSNELEKSIGEVPLNFRSALKLGQLYNIYGRLDSSKLEIAEEVLNRARDLSPNNQQVYWALAQTKLYQGKFEETISLAEKAVELEPRVKDSHLIVVRVAKLIGKYDLVKQKAEEAIAINPSWEPEIKEILEKQ
ncbi:MAG: hypothetical protein E3J36_02590 [Candidatus Nealsonbacteria bacterium]|nr:MAG: hypothetical protein E3J36_02590 [Candidatus Nealsonbacteria bacterium]